MVRAFRAFWRAVKDIFDEFLLMAICNVLWSLISLPLLVVSNILLLTTGVWPAIAVGLLAVLPLAPATAGFYVIAQRTTEGRVSKVGDFFAGMRRYALPAWRTLGVWAIGLVIILVDLSFYMGVDNFIGSLILGLWFYLLVVWLGLLIYIFPLMLLQERPDLRTIARNALLMTVGRPIFTLTTLVLMGLVVATALLIPLLTPLFFLFIVALLVQWSMRATQTLIKEAEDRRAAEQAAAEATAPPPAEKGRRGQVRPK